MDEDMPPGTEDTSAAPAIAALLAVLAVQDLTEDSIVERLAVSTAMASVLAAIAARAIHWLASQSSQEVREALMRVEYPKIVELAVEDGVKVVEAALENTIEHMRETGEVPDQKYAEALARHTAQTVQNAVVFYAAEEASKVSTGPTWRKRWHSKKDHRVRSTHAFLGSPSYEYHSVDIDDPFITIKGNRLRFPKDPIAPASETQNCRCWLTVYLTT